MISSIRQKIAGFLDRRRARGRERARKLAAWCLAVLAVIVGIAFANEARLNRNEPRCRYWADVSAFGCAEHGEPHLPPFLPPVQHAR
jgi:hypothetical protein